jgi:hypothetical protein
MHAVLAQFDPTVKKTTSTDLPNPTARPFTSPPDNAPKASISVPDGSAEPDLLEDGIVEGGSEDSVSLSTLLPPDPLLDEVMHKIMFALEMVAWDRLPTQVVEAPEIRNLKLEAWEADSYRKLAEGRVEKGTAEWELLRFFLSSATLRLKMEEEATEIVHLEGTGNPERLSELLERSAQSLERARDTDHRFKWFIDDMLFRGETHKLEQIYRSRFRFLHAYSGLWLNHQQSGGLTPL